MSTFKVEVVRIGKIEKHPNADRLSKTQIHAFPVIMQSGNFVEGDLAAYVPSDAHVPLDNPVFEFLKTKDNAGKARERIRAKKLRGTFSMGILMPPPPGAKEGDDAAEYFGIIKYEAPPPQSGDSIADPGFIPTYTNIESFRAYPDILVEGEEVVMTEKLHGENCRLVYYRDQLWVGSHTNIKLDHPLSPFWKMAHKLGAAEILKKAPGMVMYGEVFGHNKKMRYGMEGDKSDRQFRVFDVLNIETGKFLNHDDGMALAKSLGFELVPELYRGPFSVAKFQEIANGNSVLGRHTREGAVTKPLVERFDERTGRVILKLTAEAYELGSFDDGTH